MTTGPDTVLPDRAEVVIVGGGIIGCSIAYHLTKRGVSDVVVLEQGQLTGGTTWHAAGLVSQLKSSHSLTRLATYSTRLFESLEDETGQSTGYRTTGSISVASDAERWEEIMRGLSMARTVGVDMRVIDPFEAKERWPLLNIEDLVGAVFIPRDGQTSPVDTTMALARGARNRGARIFEGVGVDAVVHRAGRVAGVETTTGFLEAETVVLAAGMWTRQLAATAGISVPLQACEHFYLVTEPIEGLPAGLPTLRDPTNYTYFKEETGKVMAGFFEPRGKVWNLDHIPADFTFGTLAEDWDHVGPIFERALHRMPALADAGIQLFFNGPEAFTPDGVYHLGEAPEVERCFVAAGFNSVGIQSAGGAGWVLADWIVDGHPPMDLWPVDLRRTFPFQSESGYLSERIPESLGLLYAMHWPFRQYESARGTRTTPLHGRLEEAGAVFGETAGWERPNWFAQPGQEREYRYSYGPQNWFEASGEECSAVRNSVGLFDQTSFAKYEVAGTEALAVLQHVCAGDVDTEDGEVVYTQWLNERGGIEADVTVTRLDEDRFLVVTGAAVARRDWTWLSRQGRGADIQLTDVTDQYAVLGVMGPEARSLLSAITSADLSNEAFPYTSAQRIEAGGSEVLALRVSYVGELGWELYVPAANAGAVYDAISDAGSSHGLRPAGYHAMNSLRLEAGYRHWGHDMTDEDTPLEAGLAFAVAWDKPGGFLGREALVRQRSEPRRKRLVQFRVDSGDRLLYHDEPIFGDGVLVGRTTSAMWSYQLNAPLAMGYVNDEGGVNADYVVATEFSIEVAGDRFPAQASLKSFYPARERVLL